MVEFHLLNGSTPLIWLLSANPLNVSGDFLLSNHSNRLIIGPFGPSCSRIYYIEQALLILLWSKITYTISFLISWLVRNGPSETAHFGQ